MTLTAPDSAAPRRAPARVLIPILAAAFLGACPRPLHVVRPYAAPTAAELAEALTAHQRAVSSINARARATSWLGGDRVRATMLMLVDRAGRLRFEAEVSLRGTVAILATDGNRFAFLDTTQNELRRGPACPANVASLIRIPLAPPDVAAILLGDVRLPAPIDSAAGVVDWDPVQGADVLALRRNDGWLRVLFQRVGAWGTARSENRIVGAVATGPDGSARWRVSFEDFAEVRSGSASDGGATTPSASLPGTIRFAEGEASFDEGVEIKFKERTLNDIPGANAFDLVAAPGTTTVDVGCPSSSP